MAIVFIMSNREKDTWIEKHYYEFGVCLIYKESVGKSECIQCTTE